MDPVETMRRRAAEIGCTLEEVWDMTVAEFMQRVAEHRARSEWSRNVQAHCRDAADNSIATLRALGKSPSRVQRAVGR